MKKQAEQLSWEFDTGQAWVMVNRADGTGFGFKLLPVSPAERNRFGYALDRMVGVYNGLSGARAAFETGRADYEDCARNFGDLIEGVARAVADLLGHLKTLGRWIQDVEEKPPTPRPSLGELFEGQFVAFIGFANDWLRIAAAVEPEGKTDEDVPVQEPEPTAAGNGRE